MRGSEGGDWLAGWALGWARGSLNCLAEMDRVRRSKNSQDANLRRSVKNVFKTSDKLNTQLELFCGPD